MNLIISLCFYIYDEPHIFGSLFLIGLMQCKDC